MQPVYILTQLFRFHNTLVTLFKITVLITVSHKLTNFWGGVAFTFNGSYSCIHDFSFMTLKAMFMLLFFHNLTLSKNCGSFLVKLICTDATDI